MSDYKITEGRLSYGGSIYQKGDPIELTEDEAKGLGRWITVEPVEKPVEDDSEASDSNEKSYHQLLAFAASEGFLAETGRSKDAITAYISENYEDQ